MSRATIPKIFMAGGAVGFTYYMFMRQYWFPKVEANPMKTQGVQNIEDRFTKGGAQPDRTPARGTAAGTTDTTPRPGGSNNDDFRQTQQEQKGESELYPKKFYETVGDARNK
ncbi:hypothetical protein M011DRAFT_524451 [Sporormia fimetaria CBS 119925]|uniref:Uncharacterized protein n=1 Tax=Sporormia fimetaria CBS 119925 TaxID=1340428 RepID=A0A6A6VI30_9PLEO|nr:hypothetical protein M011DRAFT_524451 [Sporormia fimetaria CBS 119925]